MKPAGIVKRVDHLGRILLPKELRKAMQIETNDPFEIFVEENMIILKKYQLSCIFCNQTESVQPFKGKAICADCLAALTKESACSES